MGEPAPLSLHYHIVVLAVKSQNEIIKKKQPTHYAPHFQNIKYHYFFLKDMLYVEAALRIDAN